MRLIHNPQSVTCPLCNKPFKTKLYLKRHLVSFHELSVADRQRQEEIYHHHVKVEAQRQGQGQSQIQGQAQVQTQQVMGPTQAQGQTQVQGQIQIQEQVQVQGQVQTDKSIHVTPPPRLPPEEGGGNSCKIIEKRPFQSIDDDSYEVAQIGDTKNFVGSVLQQFNATFH